MGILIKGNPYTSEVFVDSMRAEEEKQKKLYQEFMELKKRQAKKGLLEKFEEYKNSLTQEEINKIVPPTELIKERSNFQELMLKEKFEAGEIP